MTTHFPQIDAGTRLGKNESDVMEKDKHFFDEDEIYQQGWSWYTSRYSNCSTSVDDGNVGADFTETYLESGSMTARKISADYGQVAPSHGVESYLKLKFVVMLRDPVDRLFSYYTSAKADNTLDIQGVTGLSRACQNDISTCEDLTFDSWAYDQVERASVCEKNNPDEDLWPSCGDTGLFGGLYSQQIKEYLSFFNATQIAVVPMEAYTSDAPQLLENLGAWLELDFVKNGMTQASDLSTSEESTAGSTQMAAATRSMLGNFYAPYVKDLYDVISRTDVTFIDIISLKDIFR